MSEPMTQQRLDEITKRCEAATPGPWTLTGSKHQLVDSDDKAPMYKSIVCEVWHDTPNNAAFIVHARRDIPDLLAEVERLRAERRWIPVEERLPEHDGHVIILSHDQQGDWQVNVSACMRVGFGGQKISARAWMEPYECFFRHDTITHWMPLPDAPIGRKEG